MTNTFVVASMFIISNIYLPKVNTNKRSLLRLSRIISNIGLIMGLVYTLFLDVAPVPFKTVLCVIMILINISAIFNYSKIEQRIKDYIYINKKNYEVEKDDYHGDDVNIYVVEINGKNHEVYGHKYLSGKTLIIYKDINGTYCTQRPRFEFTSTVAASCLYVIGGLSYTALGSTYLILTVSTLLILNGLISYILIYDCGDFLGSLLDALRQSILWISIILNIFVIFRK